MSLVVVCVSTDRVRSQLGDCRLTEGLLVPERLLVYLEADFSDDAVPAVRDMDGVQVLDGSHVPDHDGESILVSEGRDDVVDMVCELLGRLMLGSSTDLVPLNVPTVCVRECVPLNRLYVDVMVVEKDNSEV